MRASRMAAIIGAAAGAGGGLAHAMPAPRVAFASPLQRWSSPDGQVHLLRPLISQVGQSGDPVGSLMTGGWRLIWDGSSSTPGRTVVRLSMKVKPVAPETRSALYLQVGVGRTPADVRSCLSYGLKGPSTKRLADRVINGRRFAVWTNSDAGMSQSIAATDLRTVAAGACWAVERFSYSNSASDPDPSVTLAQARGEEMMDASLASLQLGPVKPGEVISPPTIRLPRGVVVR